MYNHAITWQCTTKVIVVALCHAKSLRHVIIGSTICNWLWRHLFVIVVPQQVRTVCVNKLQCLSSLHIARKIVCGLSWSGWHHQLLYVLLLVCIVQLVKIDIFVITDIVKFVLFTLIFFNFTIVSLTCCNWVSNNRSNCIVKLLPFFPLLCDATLHVTIYIIDFFCVAATAGVTTIILKSNILFFLYFIVHISVKQSRMGNSRVGCDNGYIKRILLLLFFLMRFTFAFCTNFACLCSRCWAVDHRATVKIYFNNFNRLRKYLVRHATHAKAVLLCEHHTDRVLKCHHTWQVNTTPWVHSADWLQVRAFNRYSVLHPYSR